MRYKTLFLSFFFFSCLLAEEDPRNLATLYNSLDPLSISQYLAFYELYPDTESGKEALGRAWELLHIQEKEQKPLPLILPSVDIPAMISLITKEPSAPPVSVQEEELNILDSIAKNLANRRLKGSSIWSIEELNQLTTDEIDLARALLLHQCEKEPDSKRMIRQYEASLDLMALQILARLPMNASPEEKIRQINRFIFQEMQFRFPPHSLHAKDIDLYTFLPSVLDSRQGVCLGVSILYLSLAQRLDLELEIITPPGHIFLRYNTGEKFINIETTARGINLPSETYLGINTRSLDKRTVREVIGMAFVNQASVAWGHEDYKATISLYEKASIYMPDDPLTKMLLGFNYLFIGETKQGKNLLSQIKNLTFAAAVSKETMVDDLLDGKCDADAIKAIFLHVDETRESVLKKQKKLQTVLEKFPSFRAGLLQLAISWLQLGRSYEGLEVLKRYDAIDPNDCTVSYYLSILHGQRYDHNLCWYFLKRAELLSQARNHRPKALKALRDQLRRVCPEPEKIF